MFTLLASTPPDVQPSNPDSKFAVCSTVAPHGGGIIPVPCILKLYGFSSESSLAIVKVAVLRPTALGLNVMVKLVLLPAVIVFEGIVVTEKSAAFAPEIVTYGDEPVKFKVFTPPKFSITNEFVFVPPAISILPKSVPSATCGVVSPSLISLVLPVIFISCKGELATILTV